MIIVIVVIIWFERVHRRTRTGLGHIIVIMLYSMVSIIEPTAAENDIITNTEWFAEQN